MSRRALAQAVHLKHLAERLERGERTLGPDLEEALAHDLQEHPDEAAELEELEATQVVPDWHRAILDDRLAREDDVVAEPWQDVIAAIRSELGKTTGGR